MDCDVPLFARAATTAAAAGPQNVTPPRRCTHCTMVKPADQLTPAFSLHDQCEATICLECWRKPGVQLYYVPPGDTWRPGWQPGPPDSPAWRPPAPAPAADHEQQPAATRLPIDQAAPLPIDQDAPLPIDHDAPLPIDQDAPLPIDQDAPLPIDHDAPLPIDPGTSNAQTSTRLPEFTATPATDSTDQTAHAGHESTGSQPPLDPAQAYDAMQDAAAAAAAERAAAARAARFPPWEQPPRFPAADQDAAHPAPADVQPSALCDDPRRQPAARETLHYDGDRTSDASYTRKADPRKCPKQFTAAGKTRTVPCMKWTCPDCGPYKAKKYAQLLLQVFAGKSTVVHAVLRAPDIKAAWNRFRTRLPQLKYIAVLEPRNGGGEPDRHLHVMMSCDGADVQRAWLDCGGTYIHVRPAVALWQQLLYVIGKRIDVPGSRLSHSHGLPDPTPGQPADELAAAIMRADQQTRSNPAQSVQPGAAAATTSPDRQPPRPAAPPDFITQLRAVLTANGISGQIQIVIAVDNQTELLP